MADHPRPRGSPWHLGDNGGLKTDAPCRRAWIYTIFSGLWRVKRRGRGREKRGEKTKSWEGGWEEEREVGRGRGERGISYLFRRRMERKRAAGWRGGERSACLNGRAGLVS